MKIPNYVKKVQELEYPSNIKREDCIIIPETTIIITKFEPDGFKGLNWEKTHRFVYENGLEVPTPKLFMPYTVKVRDAYKGRIQLYDGNGEQIGKEETKDIYFHQTTNHINGGAWSHLNARFVRGSGFNNLDLETVIGIENGKLITGREPLVKCLMQDCYAKLIFNKQGLAVKKSRIQEYKQGKNIKFYTPIENAVTWCWADSGRVGLDCVRDPGGSDSALGVFVSAEGTPKNLEEKLYSRTQIENAVRDYMDKNLNVTKISNHIIKSLEGKK